LEIILRHPTFGRRRSVVPHSLGVSVSPCETTTLFPQVFKMSQSESPQDEPRSNTDRVAEGGFWHLIENICPAKCGTHIHTNFSETIHNLIGSTLVSDSILTK
jgi:hypothetical protein